MRIDVASVNTGNERRDEHLRSGDFFEADAHPYITFESTRVWEASENRLIARGDLTIKGETREVDLPIEVLGVMDVPAEMQEMLGGGRRIASFATGLQIDRSDYASGSVAGPPRWSSVTRWISRSPWKRTGSARAVCSARGGRAARPASPKR